MLRKKSLPEDKKFRTAFKTDASGKNYHCAVTSEDLRRTKKIRREVWP